MPLTIDYYFAPQSPWTYLGHARFAQIAAEAGAAIRVLPVDLGGRVFPVSGGLPLAKRAPQRQAQFLGLPLNLEPKFFPVNYDDAAKLITAVDMNEGTEAAMRLTAAVLAACWAQERNIADAVVLGALLAECGLPSRRLEDAQSQAVHTRYESNTQAAVDAGVFGAPSYVVEGEIFWGQDRLDFVQRRLAAKAGQA
jgi:2-hydroxychromene-2-carboxylate isomerase